MFAFRINHSDVPTVWSKALPECALDAEELCLSFEDDSVAKLLKGLEAASLANLCSDDFNCR